jgi:uncharacterized protein
MVLSDRGDHQRLPVTGDKQMTVNFFGVTLCGIILHLFSANAFALNPAELCSNEKQYPVQERPALDMKQNQLIDAILDHDSLTAKNLIQTGLNLNYYSRRNLGTPLSEAIAEHQAEIIKSLLQNGADVNFGAEHGVAALGVAAWYLDVSTAAELLRRGAALEARNEEGYTPLLVATTRPGSIGMINLLLSAGANAKARGAEINDTTLMLAAEQGNIEGVRTLLKVGVDPCVRDKDGKTAADYLNPLRSAEVNKEILQLLPKSCERSQNMRIIAK